MDLREFKNTLIVQGNAFVLIPGNRYREKQLVEITPENIAIGRKWIIFRGARYSFRHIAGELIFVAERQVGTGNNYRVFWTMAAYEEDQKRRDLGPHMNADKLTPEALNEALFGVAKCDFLSDDEVHVVLEAAGRLRALEKYRGTIDFESAEQLAPIMKIEKPKQLSTNAAKMKELVNAEADLIRELHSGFIGEGVVERTTAAYKALGFEWIDVPEGSGLLEAIAWDDTPEEFIQREDT